MKKIYLLLIATLIMLNLSVAALAMESFSITPSSKVIPACSCDNGHTSVTIYNLNPFTESRTYVIDGIAKEYRVLAPTPSKYNILLSGSASEFVFVSESTFDLLSGESKEISVSWSLPCSAKDLDLVMTIMTDKGVSHDYRLDFDVERCPNLKLTPLINSAQSCPSQTVSFEYNLKNTGTFTDTYTIIMDQFREDALLNINPVTLEPDQSKKIVLDIALPYDIVGKYSGTFTVKSSKGQVAANTPYVIDILPCYDYSVFYGNPSVMPTKDASIPSFSAYGGSMYEMCLDVEYLIPLLFRNDETIENHFFLELESDYMSLSEDDFVLGSGMEKTIFLKASPKELDNLGLHLAEIEVFSQIGAVESKFIVPLTVINCYRPELSKERIIVGYLDNLTSVSLTNTGEQETSYDLSMFGPEWVSLDVGTITIPPYESAAVYLLVDTSEDVLEGEYAITYIVKESSTDVEYEFHSSITITDDKIFCSYHYSDIKTCISKYKWEILGVLMAFVILLALFLVPMYLKKQPKKQKPIQKKIDLKKSKVEAKAAKLSAKADQQLDVIVKPKKKKYFRLKFFFTIFIVLFLILALVGIGIFSYNYYKSQKQAIDENLFDDEDLEEPLSDIEDEIYNLEKEYIYYEQDEILEILESGLYGYDMEGRVVNTQTGEFALLSDFVEDLKANRQFILDNVDISQSALDRMIQIFEFEAQATDSLVKEEIDEPQIEEEPVQQETEQNAASKEDYATIVVPVQDDFAMVDCDIELFKNDFFSINLSSAFHDPDNDELTYTASGYSNFSVLISEEIAELIPNENFVGVDYMTFTADDLHGGIVSSELTLCVRDQGEKIDLIPFICSRTKDYFLAYLSYIIAGLAILVLIIFIIKHFEKKDSGSVNLEIKRNNNGKKKRIINVKTDHKARKKVNNSKKKAEKKK